VLLGAGRSIVFQYDALDRLIGREEFDFDTGTAPIATTAYTYDGSTRILESDVLDSGKITRSYVPGTGGEILAIEQTISGDVPQRIWMFTDASGSVTSIGTVDPQGVWQIQHRQFDEFGVLNFGSLDTTVSGDRNSLLDNVPPIWNGALQQELKGALDKVYLMNGRWFDEQLGRFLSEDPQGYGGGQTNLYVLNGNDPFATVSQTGIDWSKLEGPSPFNGLGAFGFGFYDAFAFGHFDDIIMADGAQQYAAQNGWYYAGMAFGVVSQIAIGNIAAGHLTAMSAASAAGTAAQVGAAARTATVAARAYQAYSLAGDAVGVYDSVDAYFSGEFSAMDLLGFAPTIGWASKGIDGLKSLGDIPGIRRAGTALLNDIRYAPRRGVLNLGAFDGSAPNSGVVGKVWGPAHGAGPLGPKIANTFRGGSYVESVVDQPITLYRVYGGGAGKLGPYWSRVKPSGPLQSQLDSALVPSWGNTAENITTIRVPRGTTIFDGVVGPQSTGVGELLGGGSQVYIPRVDPTWILP